MPCNLRGIVLIVMATMATAMGAALAVASPSTSIPPPEGGGTEASSSLPTLIPYLDGNGLFGYVDGSGVMRIASQFQDAKPFAGGFAAAEKNALWGFIKPNGDWLVKPRFTSVADGIHGKVEDGYAVGEIETKWAGLGQEPQSTTAQDGGFVIPSFHPSLTFHKSRLADYCVDHNGVVKEVVWPNATCRQTIQNEEPAPFDGGTSIKRGAVKFDSKDYSSAVVDASGRALTPYQFDPLPTLEYLSDLDLASVACVGSGGDRNGIVNAKGQLVVECRYESVVPIVRHQHLMGYIGLQTEPYALVLLNEAGSVNKVVPGMPMFDQNAIFQGRFINIISHERIEAFDLLENRMVDAAVLLLPEGDLRDIETLGDDDAHRPVAVTTKHEKQCFYTDSLKRVACGFESIAKIGDNRYRVCDADVKTKCGVLDSLGQIVIAKNYSNEFTFRADGLALVVRDGEHFYIDNNGKEYRKVSASH